MGSGSEASVTITIRSEKVEGPRLVARAGTGQSKA
jgi:hypothetical protein